MSDNENTKMPAAKRKVDNHDVALKVYIDALLIDDDLLDASEVKIAAEVAIEPKAPVRSVARSAKTVEAMPAAEPEIKAPSLTDVALRQTIEKALLRQEQKTEQQALKQAQPVVKEAPKPTVQEVPVSAAPVPAVKPSVDINTSQKPEQITGVPEWAEKECEALMFKVGGFLTLATPLVELNTILTWRDGAVMPMPGGSEWFLGLLKVRDRQVKVIDIAKFVIPKNHKAREGLDERGGFKHIVIVGDGEFGLACDELGDVISVTPDGVRWRTDRSARPWLAGTVVEHMCALLDMDVFCQMLKEGLSADEIEQ